MSQPQSLIYALVDKKTNAIVRTFIGSRAAARMFKTATTKIVQYAPVGTV